MLSRIRYAILLGGSLGAATTAAQMAALSVGSSGLPRTPRPA